MTTTNLRTWEKKKRLLELSHIQLCQCVMDDLRLRGEGQRRGWGEGSERRRWFQYLQFSSSWQQQCNRFHGWHSGSLVLLGHGATEMLKAHFGAASPLPSSCTAVETSMERQILLGLGSTDSMKRQMALDYHCLHTMLPIKSWGPGLSQEKEHSYGQ